MKTILSKYFASIYMNTVSIMPVLLFVFLFVFPLSMFAADDEKKEEGEKNDFTLNDVYDSEQHPELGYLSIRYGGELYYSYTDDVNKTACLCGFSREKLKNDEGKEMGKKGVNLKKLPPIPDICVLTHLNPLETHNNPVDDPHAGHTFQYMVTCITTDALQAIPNLEEATIANKYITEIPNNLFEGSKDLKVVKIAGAVQKIGLDIFGRLDRKCEGVRELWLGRNIREFGNEAFAGAENLKDVYVEWKTKDEIPVIKNNVFPHKKDENQNEYIDATLHVPEGKTGLYNGVDQWNSFKEIIEYKGELHFTMSADGKGAVLASAGNSTGKVDIPASVNIEGKDLPVIGIGNAAFANNTAVTAVSMPETIAYIEAWAFSGCSSISEMTSNNPTPPQLMAATSRAGGSSVASQFEGMDLENCILYVPKGTASDYLQAYGWSNFKNIVDGTSVTDISPIRQTTDDGSVYYNLNGQRVIKPSKGIYIKGGKKVLY